MDNLISGRVNVKHRMTDLMYRSGCRGGKSGKETGPKGLSCSFEEVQPRGGEASSCQPTFPSRKEYTDGASERTSEESKNFNLNTFFGMDKLNPINMNYTSEILAFKIQIYTRVLCSNHIFRNEATLAG